MPELQEDATGNYAPVTITGTAFFSERSEELNKIGSRQPAYDKSNVVFTDNFEPALRLRLKHN
jgi:hypothetical protein